MKVTERGILNVALSMALIILAISAVYAYLLNRELIDANKWVNHTHLVIEKAAEVDSVVNKITANVGNYLVSGDKYYIKDLPVIVEKAKQDASELLNMTQDNPIQQTKVTELIVQINKKINLQSKIITAYQKHNKDQVIQLKTGNITKDMNQKINLLTSDLVQRELGLLKMRTVKLDYYAHKSKLQMILTCILGEIFLICSIILVNTHLIKRNQIERRLTSTEKELMKNKVRYDFALMGSKTALWEWECETDKVFFSDELKRMLGYEELGDTLTQFYNLLHPDDKEATHKHFQEHLNINEPYIVEYRLKLKSGDYRWYQFKGQAIFNDKGEAIRMAGSIIDISERKDLDKAKNEFISIVSHELRTPLTSIHGSISLLDSGLFKLSNEGTQLIKIAKNNSERLIRLINDILDIEKLEIGKVNFHFIPINLNRILEEAVINNQAYADKFSVKLILNKSISQIIVNSDHDRLMQVLTNLISNAIKFSPKDEVVTISTSIPHENKVRVEVKNKGIGIAKKFRPKIFQKFSQLDSSTSREHEGTGLGLSICKAIIENLGGYINFRSKPNIETTFYFDLPTDKEKNKLVVKSELGIQTRNLPTVLVCEHDKDTANLIELILKKEHFQTMVANTLTSAEEVLLKQTVDVLILDLYMPNEENSTFLSEIKKLIKSQILPIVIITMDAYHKNQYLVGESLNVIDWLDKPIDTPRLIETLHGVKKALKIDKIHILHVEDDVELSQVVAMGLRDEGEITNVTTIKDAKESLCKNKYDVAILDIRLPDGSGLYLLPELSHLKIPIIIYSAYDLPKEFEKYVISALLKTKNSNEDLINAIKVAVNLET